MHFPQGDWQALHNIGVDVVSGYCKSGQVAEQFPMLETV